jgi:hypothetical protein
MKDVIMAVDTPKVMGPAFNGTVSIVRKLGESLKFLSEDNETIPEQ